MRALPVFVSAFALSLLCAAPALAQEPEQPAGRGEAAEEKDASEEALGEEEAAEEAAPAKPKVALPGDEVDDDEPEPPLLPAAQDTVGGHLQLSPSAALVIPFGELSDGTSQSSVLGIGPGFALDVGFGVSRSVVLGAWGQLVSFGAGSECSDCSATSLAGGAFVRYHLVQGVRFDPWLSAGVGFRTLTAGVDDARFSGFDFMRFQVGGDWYPARFLGFGPFAELDAGAYTSQPGDADSAAYFQFATGLRLTLDVPGK
ncbi:MAG TPA: hypothetical protein VK524_04630 [Polyangiaceae bacterium]|nr:hypothetical protein [Polyangiaceae bacterium]